MSFKFDVDPEVSNTVYEVGRVYRERVDDLRDKYVWSLIRFLYNEDLAKLIKDNLPNIKLKNVEMVHDGRTTLLYVTKYRGLPQQTLVFSWDLYGVYAHNSFENHLRMTQELPVRKEYSSLIGM